MQRWELLSQQACRGGSSCHSRPVEVGAPVTAGMQRWELLSQQACRGGSSCHSRHAEVGAPVTAGMQRWEGGLRSMAGEGHVTGLRS